MLGDCRPGSVGRHLCHSFGKGTLENEANTKENRARWRQIMVIMMQLCLEQQLSLLFPVPRGDKSSFLPSHLRLGFCHLQ